MAFMNNGVEGCRCYMAEILPIRPKTLSNQSINQSWKGVLCACLLLTQRKCIYDNNTSIKRGHGIFIWIIW